MKNTKIYSLLNCLGGSSVCFGSMETSKLSVSVKKRNNRKKPKKTKKTEKNEKNRKNRKNPKFSLKQQTMRPIKLIRLVFCLFRRFNRNIETLCFGIEAKQPKQSFVSDSFTNVPDPQDPCVFGPSGSVRLRYLLIRGSGSVPVPASHGYTALVLFVYARLVPLS